MADKDITIGIKTTGAEASASDVRKVEDAVDDLARAQRQAQYDAGKAGGMGGQLAPGVSLPSRDNEAANAAAVRSFADLKDKANVAQFAFYDLDAEIARTGNTIETVAAGPITRGGAKIQAASGGIKNMGLVATQVGYQVTDFATQVSMGTSAITAFAQQAPQAIGAFTQFGSGATGVKDALMSSVSGGTAFTLILTEIAIGMKLVIDEYGRMTAAQKKLAESAKDFAKQQQFQAEQQAKLNLLMRQDFVADYYQRQGDELERVIRGLERVNELRAAQGSVESTQAASAVTIARNTGGDVTGAQANALAVGVRNQLDALDSKISEMQAAAAKATQEAEAARAKVAEASLEGDRYSDKFKALEADAEKTANIASEAQLDLEAERQKYDFAKQEIIANAEAGISDLQTGSDAAIKAAAEAAKTALQAQAEAAGGDISSNAKAALDGLVKIMADGVIKPEELATLKSAMDQMHASREAANSEVLGALRRGMASDRVLQDQINALQQQMGVNFSRGR